MITLAKDGIFPITKDEHGKTLAELPASGFSFPGTIQGEGKLNGIPSLFVRVAGCNLHCCWTTDAGTESPCDTAHAAYSVTESTTCGTVKIAHIIEQNRGNMSHLVITGGEPFLQSKELTVLCKQLKACFPYHITVETNATLYNEELATQIDFFSLSPKLATSTPKQEAYAKAHRTLRINIPCIQSFITHARRNNKDFQLKFVYAGEHDIEEIEHILQQLTDWENDDILLMPLGANAEELRNNTMATLRHCITHGWRYCDRLHISLFGAKHGV